MKTKRVVFISVTLMGFLLGGTCFTNAMAGWYKTQWGMKIEDLRSALPEQITEIPREKRNAYGRAEYTFMIHDFIIDKCRYEVLLAVDKQKGLNEVMVRLKNGEKHYGCFLDLETSLKKKYGPPSDVKQDKKHTSELQQREWITKDTIVQLNRVVLWIGQNPHETTNVIYQPRVAGDKDKL